MSKRAAALAKLIASMLIFGSIGLLVRYIPLGSSMIAFMRAIIGVIFLLIILLLKQQKISLIAVKQNLLFLVLSGAAIGFNWILLFESYRYTSVAVSTVCYYMAPIIVISLSPFVLKERITIRRLFCIIVAILGIALISGVFDISNLQGKEITGILFGLGAACLYATAILLNKQMGCIESMDRTVCQLFVASIILLVYNLLSSGFSFESITPVSMMLLAVAGIVHTGLAYYLYFGSMEHLSGQSIAIASYIDPVVAVMISAVILQESLTTETIIGAIAILGAAFVSEISSNMGTQS